MDPIADDIVGLTAVEIIEAAREQIQLHNGAANVYCLEHQSTRAARHTYEHGISASRPHSPLNLSVQ